MKELFKCQKDHKNPFMEELVNSSYQYCFQDEFESFIGNLRQAQEKKMRVIKTRLVLVLLLIGSESDARY